MVCYAVLTGIWYTVNLLLDILTLKMKALQYLESSVTVCLTTQSNIPEYLNLESNNPVVTKGILAGWGVVLAQNILHKEIYRMYIITGQQIWT